MDRISSLPNEVLTHILSFLGTKEAVQTIVLSKRWRDPWSFLPILRFDIEDWADTAIIDEEALAEAEEKFKKHLNGVLDNRASSHLEIFEYRNFITESESEVSLEFLDRVVLQNPRVVSIDVSRANRLNFPDSIFSCPSLEKLVLSIITENVTVISPTVVNLPSLKMLEVNGIEISDEDGFMQMICSGCPALETLVLIACSLDISELSSNVLKKLTLDECLQSWETQISCPNLTSLVIESSYEMSGFELKNMASLKYASICLDLEEDNGDPKLLSSLSNVSRLDIGLWGPKFKVCFLLKMLKLNVQDI
jgi:F-box domain